ncbi:hypothetical protein K3759_00050 [Sulfitobacter sp. W027]|uniref:hypothetical protein n=1 Tax=Sulfitobacter sp. W027 TaxID=2867025 RepID=UPI0021A80823|nr:hypothetical protein [Sulfitobacter sp. W027]UWR33524.1 hypothetical protein K3759_00050 [Sulfitobacter sp. W027]
MTQKQYESFAAMVSGQVKANTPSANKCKHHMTLSLTWAALHLADSDSQHCDLLLKGAYGTAVEAVSLLAIGLVRPAILSLRAHYELSLQFLYYKDHPVEWRGVTDFRNQPNLPGVNKKYLKDFYPEFEKRFKTLVAHRNRRNEDCYAVLSGVAHGTAIHSITSATAPEELVEDITTVRAAVNVFQDAAEHISDINLSCFQGNWISLPEAIKDDLTKRFKDKQPAAELDL